MLTRVMCAVLLTCSAAVEVFAVEARDYAVEVSAAAQKSPPRITLSWRADPDATSYTLYKKDFAATSWQPGITLAATATSYADNSVTVGATYDYKLVKQANEGGAAYTGYGYVYAGIEVPVIENRGKLVLVVDRTYAADLAVELSRLQQDLVGDGWTVLRRDVNRTDGVNTVKTVIRNEYNADPANVKAVFLFGHVAVPYSGDIRPDGHTDHQGAWPADTFYGDMDGGWSDSTVNRATAARQQNWNVPGDGKFDQSQIPSDLELQVGRVDLADMPAFAPRTEKDLLRNYLNKNHTFRHGQLTAQRRGLCDDAFGVYRGFAFVQNGYRNFASFFGTQNVDTVDWLTTLGTQRYLWAYGSGGGSYTSCYGVGRTDQFAAQDPKAVFTLLLGSYFADWDSTDNLMRAVLATNTCGLQCSWGSWPSALFHHMGLGINSGHGIRLTANNSGMYFTSNSPRGVHVALMGDPTLRMHPVAPPTGLSATIAGGARLAWTPSAGGVLGYHVYRAGSSAGPFTRLTSSLVTGATYTDGSVSSGAYTYMVRAVKLETSGSGSYFNPSQGAFTNVNFGSGNQPPVFLSAARATPNPAIVAQTVSFTATAADPEGQALTYTWNFGDGTTGNGANVTHAYATTGVYNVGLTVRDTAGSTCSGSVSLRIQAYLQNSAGLLVLEAENCHNRLDQGGHTWSAAVPVGFSGSGAQQSTPNNGANIDVNVAGACPRLDYRVKFNRTGTHYLWLRGCGANGGDDSCHAGINGVVATSADKISNFPAGLNWSRSTMDGPFATLNVATTGVHTLNIWMREDGTVLDKIVLTSDSAYVPVGSGPAESTLGE